MFYQDEIKNIVSVQWALRGLGWPCEHLAWRCSRDVHADCIALCPALQYLGTRLHGLITDQLVLSLQATALQPDYTSNWHDWPVLIATSGHHTTGRRHIHIISMCLAQTLTQKIGCNNILSHVFAWFQRWRFFLNLPAFLYFAFPNFVQ